MKFEKIAIILTFFGLWLTSYFAEPSQNVFAFVLIFSVGILHGSNDLGLISELNSRSKVKRLWYFVVSYLVTVCVASALFYFLPLLALICFIVFSAFHFGEQHWHHKFLHKISGSHMFFFMYGYFILALLFYFNAHETNTIIFSLTGFKVPSTLFMWNLIVSGVITLAWTGHAFYSRSLSMNTVLFEVFLILVFSVVFKVASLIWAFAIYFIIWHSVPSILEQLSYLYGDRSAKALLRYVRASWLIWVVSVTGIFGIYYWIADSDTLFYPIFFALLGAITFAHVFTISKMFGSKT
ncbi:MAG: Brp/Blh family beta-carotene 15,15'-dioxygenase [Bacteroidota bacterium]